MIPLWVKPTNRDQRRRSCARYPLPSFLPSSPLPACPRFPVGSPDLSGKSMRGREESGGRPRDRPNNLMILCHRHRQCNRRRRRRRPPRRQQPLFGFWKTCRRRHATGEPCASGSSATHAATGAEHFRSYSTVVTKAIDTIPRMGHWRSQDFALRVTHVSPSVFPLFLHSL